MEKKIKVSFQIEIDKKYLKILNFKIIFEQINYYPSNVINK